MVLEPGYARNPEFLRLFSMLGVAWCIVAALVLFFVLRDGLRLLRLARRKLQARSRRRP